MKAVQLFVALMEALKLHAVASYLFIPMRGRLPFGTTTLGLLAAAALGGFLRTRGGRVVYRLLAHALGVSLFFVVLYAEHRGIPVSAIEFLVQDTAVIALVAAAALAFWFRGAHLGRKPPDHAECVSLFDKGLGIFLAAFSIAALTRMENPFPVRLALPYFLFGILALGLSRGGAAGRGGLGPRKPRSGLPLAAAAFTVAAAGVYTLTPALFAPAARAGRSLGESFDRLTPYLGAFLKWLFGFGRAATAAAPASLEREAAPQLPSIEPNGPESLILSILMWSLGIIAAALLLALAGFLLAKLFRYLASRTEGEGAGPRFTPAWLMAWIRRCAAFFARFEAALAERRKERSPAAAAYVKLLSCGRAAGTALAPADTPREYARRLSAAFPRAAKDALFIAEAVEREVYGKIEPDRRGDRRLVDIRRGIRATAFFAERATKLLRGLGRQERPKSEKPKPFKG